jgi:hypothetical protein
MNSIIPIHTNQECGERRPVDTFCRCVTMIMQTAMFVCCQTPMVGTSSFRWAGLFLFGLLSSPGIK